MLFGEEGDVSACTNVHRRVEAGVLASGPAFGRHFVVELVLDLYLAGLADLAEVQGDDNLSGFAIIDHTSSHF